MNAIEIKGLTKKFKERVAVDHLNFEIKEGEFFALLGQNGAGKTTTIKMLCGLTEPTEGDAIILGDSLVNNPQAIKAKINVSPQETAVAKALNVQENLEFIAAIYGYDKDEAKKRAQEIMEEFDLKDRAKDKAKTLSGGLQRRLSIAMALISNPKIVFLDEPTLGLDVIARRALWKVIKGLKGKVTIILTTHYLEEAEALADRIAIINEGHLLTIGTPKEIEEQSGTNNLEDAYIILTQGEEAL